MSQSCSMLTPSEYRRTYGCENIKSLLDEGRVRGATKTGKNEWLIPNGALIEYRPKGKALSFDKRTIMDDMWDILKASSKKMTYIDSAVLKTSDEQFNNAVSLLVECELLIRSPTPSDSVTANGFSITTKGIARLQDAKDKRGWREIYALTIASASNGFAQAILETA